MPIKVDQHSPLWFDLSDLQWFVSGGVEERVVTELGLGFLSAEVIQLLPKLHCHVLITCARGERWEFKEACLGLVKETFTCGIN